MRRASAASVDSQTPGDPRYAGPRAGRLAPLAFTLDKAAQLLRPRRMAQLAQRLGFDLPDALARDVELLADFLQRVIGVHLDSEAHPQHLGLARRQRIQHVLAYVAKAGVDRGVDRRHRARVLDEVA